MPNIEWIQTEKQNEAWSYLTDQITTELLFGGGAGGAKSFLGCAWIIIMCGRYPGSRWLIGRSELKTLKETTLNTFFEVCSKWGIKKTRDYNYNEQKSLIKFTNGSEILLKDLKHMPSDPEYDFLGSLEITGAFVDESNQITFKCWDVLGTRIRYKLEEFCGICAGKMTPDNFLRWETDDDGDKIKIFLCPHCKQENRGLIKKLLGTCNPAKNWTYTQFYKKWKTKSLSKRHKFVQALVKDNPFAPAQYVKQLKETRNLATKERLLHGNWEYDDDIAKLFKYNEILDLFTNPVFPKENAPEYLTCDVARKGRDATVITRWKGLRCKKIYRYTHKSVLPPYFILSNGRIFKEKLPEIQGDQEISFEKVTYHDNPTKWTRCELIRLANKFGIPRSHIVVDEDGVGGGIVDELDGVIGFVNNSSALQPQEAKHNPEKRVNYANLKAQCFDQFAKFCEEAKIRVCCNDEVIRESLIEELGQIKQKDIDKDGKFALEGKDKIKGNINRSPDIADGLMMRMYFELNPINIFDPIFL